MRSTISISGSHGDLVAHIATGIVTDRGQGCDCEDCGGIAYGNIARFDPASLAHEAGADAYPSTDILAVGYWTHEGAFAEPLTVRVATDRRGWGHGMEFDDWVPLRLLPAPCA